MSTHVNPLPCIAVRLDPGLLENPNIDLRYDLEKRLIAAVPGTTVYEDGYGFCRQSRCMLLTYATSDLDRTLQALIAILENESVLGNRLAAGAVVATQPAGCEIKKFPLEYEDCTVVYPNHLAGTKLED